MVEFTPLCLALVGMIFIVQGQRITISTQFMNGSLIFRWTNVSSKRNDIVITKDSQSSRWINVADDQYTMKDVMQYKSVRIKVREYYSSYFTVYKDYNKTYNVITKQSKEGESSNISWTVPYFPKTESYLIFHEYNGSFSQIIKIIKHIPPPTEKYVYHTRPFNSTNILFEVRDITVKDAGYYVGGATEEGARSGDRGVVLVVYGKPLKPIITGDVDVKVGTYVYLKCESRSTSAPDYYKKFPPLSYSWFVNNTRIDGKYRETYSFVVSKDFKHKEYSCQANETLESERSEVIRMNPLYGPESVVITPQPPNNGLVIHDGDVFGAYNCSADCNPPCTLQWKYKNPLGTFSTLIGYSSVTLPEQTANRTSMTFIQCVANGTEGSKASDIKLNIQYFLDPRVYINNKHQNASDVKERNPLLLSCFVEGNPTPEVTLRKLTGDQILGQDVKKWLNYTSISEAQCSDTSTYSCEGNSTEFGIRNQSFNVNVLCDPRLDESMLFKTNYGSMSGPDVKVGVSFPIVANPSPSSSGFAWSGPTTQNISTKVSQRDNIIYKHWINSTIPILDKRYFGNYSLKYNGKVFVDITINPEDKPQPPLNFTGYSYASGYINLTWISNFNGGPEQFFILSRKKGSSWTVVKNLTDPGEGNLGHYDLGPSAPGQEYWYQLESCNRISCSLNPVKTRVIVPALSTSSSIFNNPTMLIVIGSSVVVLVLIVILIVVITMFFRKKKSVPQKRNSDEISAREQDNTQPEAVEYAAVDKSLLMKNRQQADVTESDVIKEKNDEDETTYSEVIKNPNISNQGDGKKGRKNGEKKELQGKTEETGASNNDQETMYSEVIKSSNMPKQTDEKKEKKKKNGEKKELQGKKEKAGSSSGNEETRTLNQDGLVYIDVEFAKKPSSSDTKGKPVIHGEEERTEYTFVDFSKKAPPT